jgi:hypothetical protein
LAPSLLPAGPLADQGSIGPSGHSTFEAHATRTLSVIENSEPGFAHRDFNFK